MENVDASSTEFGRAKHQLNDDDFGNGGRGDMQQEMVEERQQRVMLVRDVQRNASKEFGAQILRPWVGNPVIVGVYSEHGDGGRAKEHNREDALPYSTCCRNVSAVVSQ